MKSTIATDRAPQAVGPYVQGTAAFGFVFCSGQLPISPTTGEVPGSFAEQVRQSLDNVMAVLHAGGAGPSSILKTTVFLKDMNDFKEMNEIYASYFLDQLPARTTVEVARLPRDVKVEVEAIATVTEGLSS